MGFWKIKNHFLPLVCGKLFWISCRNCGIEMTRGLECLLEVGVGGGFAATNPHQ